MDSARTYPTESEFVVDEHYVNDKTDRKCGKDEIIFHCRIRYHRGDHKISANNDHNDRNYYWNLVEYQKIFKCCKNSIAAYIIEYFKGSFGIGSYLSQSEEQDHRNDVKYPIRKHDADNQ